MSPINGARTGVYAVVDTATNEKPANSNHARVLEYRSLLLSFFIRFCVAVTLCVLFLVLGEVYCYWRYRDTSRDILEPARVSVVPRTGAEREYARELEAADKVTYHPYVLWRRVPFQGSMININEDGLRRTTHTQCDGNNFTIWMFGDSTAWGTGANDDETIASLLAERYQRSGRSICVVNYGEKAWENTQEVIEVIEQLKHAPQRPNVIIFYDGGSEAFTAYQTHQADLPSNYFGFKKYLDNWSSEQKAGFSYLGQSNTNRLLNSIGKQLPFSPKMSRNAISGDELEKLAAAIMQNYEQNMDIVGLLARQYGFRAVFTWYPTLVVGHKPLTPFEQEAEAMEEEKFPGMAQLYRDAYRQCELTKRPNLYYLGDIFDDQRDSLFLGISHIRPEGNRIIADRLYQIVEHPSQPVVSKPADSSQAHTRRHARSKPA